MPAPSHKRRKRSPLLTLLKVLYIILVILSTLVVVAYAAFRIFITPPDVGGQVIFTPDPAVSWNPGTGSDDPAGGEQTPLVLTRRDGVYTCLLVGVADMGGSDTIMLGTFDTKNKTASLVSIPRDTLVLRNGSYSKINATYSSGGVELVRQTWPDAPCRLLPASGLCSYYGEKHGLIVGFEDGQARE